MSIQFSIFEARRGAPVGKRISIVEGRIAKESRVFANGKVRRAIVASLAEFTRQLAGLQAHQALSCGISDQDADIVTRAQLEELGRPPLTISRTREFFDWSDGPGVFCFDYDPSETDASPLSPAELVQTLRMAIPELEVITLAHKGSSSSCIQDGDGNLVVGMRSQHLFAIVSKASSIPELGRRIVDRLWLAGHGRIELASNGRMLERTLFDVSVWRPEHFIFNKAHCEDGLQQDLPPIQIFPGHSNESIGEGWISEGLVQPLNDDERKLFDATKAEARRNKVGEAAARRNEWLDKRVAELLDSGRSALEPKELRQSLVAALDADLLPLELSLSHEDGQMVQVEELLHDPDRWHHKRFADPIEPDYRGDRRIAVAVLKDVPRPYVFSHAHGGQRYFLKARAGSQPSDFPDLGQRLSPNGRGLRILSASEFASGAGVRWLIKGVIPQGGLAMVYGPSGSGKSFFVIDLVWKIVAGHSWNDLRTKQGRVVYVVAEGRSGFRNRLNAMAQHHGPELNSIDLGIIEEGLDLRTNSHEELIAKVKEQGGADLLVIDTLAQVVAGADENSAEDMAPVIKRCDQIVRETGATVLLVHHAGKEVSRGARGWSGIRAALDTEIQISKQDGGFLAQISKQKDGEDGRAFAFLLMQVELGEDEDGDPITSCVITHLAAATLSRKKLTGRWQKLIEEVIEEHGQFGPVPRDVLIVESCKRAADTLGAPIQESRKTELIKRALQNLLKSGRLTELDGAISSHNPTNDPHCDDLRCDTSLTPTPHNSRECGEVGREEGKPDELLG